MWERQDSCSLSSSEVSLGVACLCVIFKMCFCFFKPFLAQRFDGSFKDLIELVTDTVWMVVLFVCFKQMFRLSL